MTLDLHGQPIDSGIHARLRVDRSIHEMLGLVKGVLVDGAISDCEAIALRDWLSANSDALQVWPGHVLSARLQRIFADGRIDEDERKDLLELLEATVGGKRIDVPEANPATILPIDNPPPELVFAGKTYLFTGKFVYGTRAKCQDLVVARGGICATRVNRQVNFLVIGCIGSRDWIHTSWGRKIEEVVRLREKGLKIYIVPEEHWYDSIRTKGERYS